MNTAACGRGAGPEALLIVSSAVNESSGEFLQAICYVILWYLLNPTNNYSQLVDGGMRTSHSVSYIHQVCRFRVGGLREWHWMVTPSTPGLCE